LFRSYVLRDLVETAKADFSVVVDSSPTDSNNRTVRDFAYCSRADDRGLFGPGAAERVFRRGGAHHARPLDRHVECQPQRLGQVEGGVGALRARRTSTRSICRR
jgi:hypothetical protein